MDPRTELSISSSPIPGGLKVVALVDGEHYPAVTEWGLASAWGAGYEVLAAVVVGGVEKLGVDGRLSLRRVPTIQGGTDPLSTLREVIETHAPDAVLDLSDEPVMAYEQRMEFVSRVLAKGISYIGADFRFDPPITGAHLPVATVAVIGTGKRTGKTAISGHLARVSTAEGHRPVIVAMGRGGPPSPAMGLPEELGLSQLLSRVDRGDHAASDYLEDAITAGVITVGARRCGGGLAGRPFVTNVAEAAQRAVETGADPVILEGSGASMPTVPWDSGILVIPSGLPPAHLGGYLGPLRVLLSDLAIFTISSGQATSPGNLSTLESHVRRLHPETRVSEVELRPVPLADVKDKDVFFATTADEHAASVLAKHLERAGMCTVVGVSPRLGDRAGLLYDLESAPRFDVLATELKAAAVDVAARHALGRGGKVVFVDNRPVTVGGDGEVHSLLREVVDLAKDRAAERSKE